MEAVTGTIRDWKRLDGVDRPDPSCAGDSLRADSRSDLLGICLCAPTRRRVTLYRGVYPVVYDVPEAKTTHELYHTIFARLLELSLVERGDLVILTKGELTGIEGGTNSLQILKVSLD